MSKKIIMACMAVVALAAFALPAVASATNDPQLTSEGKLVPKGTSLTGTAVNTEFTNTEATSTLVTCSHAHMVGTVTKNEASTVEGEIPKGSAIFKGTGAESAHNKLPECTGSFGNAFITVVSALCIKSDPTMVTDEFQVTGCATKVKFIIGSTTAGECEYESTGAVKGDYTTGGTGTSLKAREKSEGSGSTRIRGGFLCPTTGALRMTFNLKTTSGTALTIS